MASDLVELGTLSAQMLAFLKLCVTSRRSIVVSGGTGAGKTTLLNLLSGFIGQDERVITIEDAAELRLDHRNLVSLEARPSNSEGRGLVSVRDLVKNALRMRPDRIVVGECRGGEALDMLQAMNTGHDGSLTTVHANSPRDALSRIEVMTLMSGVDIPLQAIREQIASAVHIVVQQARCPDGRRRVTDISEVTGIESGRILMQSLFRLQSTEGRVPRHLASGHIPQFLEGIPNARSAGLLDLFGSAA
jgi:pilus assembly protein CpaF